jgi:hypothetical protein
MFSFGLGVGCKGQVILACFMDFLFNLLTFFFSLAVTTLGYHSYCPACRFQVGFLLYWLLPVSQFLISRFYEILRVFV